MYFIFHASVLYMFFQFNYTQDSPFSQRKCVCACAWVSGTTLALPVEPTLSACEMFDPTKMSTILGIEHSLSL